MNKQDTLDYFKNMGMIVEEVEATAEDNHFSIEIENTIFEDSEFKDNHLHTDDAYHVAIAVNNNCDCLISFDELVGLANKWIKVVNPKNLQDVKDFLIK